jgi:hypothetical protein
VGLADVTARADSRGVAKPSFARITWDGENDQHFILAAAEIVPGFAVLCGKRGPEVFGEMNETEEQIEKPMCRRCARAWSKINRRWVRLDAEEFAESSDAI